MARLCFHQEPPPPPLPGDVETNELLPKGPRGSGVVPRAAPLLSMLLLLPLLLPLLAS